MAEIAKVTFEDGDLLEFTAAVTDGGDLSVTAPAALVGDYGLQVTIDDTTSIYGYIVLPAPVTTGVVRYRFYFDPNSITMAAGTQHSLVMIADLSSNPVSFLMLQRNEDNTYGLYGVCIDDTGNHANSLIYTITDEPHYIEVETRRATGPSASDGYTRFWVDGVFAYSSQIGIDNYDWMNDYQLIIIGAPSGIDSGTSGTIYLDDLVVRDDEDEIGPDVPPAVDITISGAANGHTAGSLALTSTQALSSSDTSVGHTASVGQLTQSHVLSVSGSSHGATANVSTLGQVHSLVVDGTFHVESAEAQALSQLHMLQVFDADSAHTAESVEFEVVGDLLILGATHASLSLDVTLTQSQVLTVQGVSTGHLAESVSLALDGDLVLGGASHVVHSGDVALQQVHTLLIASAASNHWADNLTFFRQQRGGFVIPFRGAF